MAPLLFSTFTLYHHILPRELHFETMAPRLKRQNRASSKNSKGDEKAAAPPSTSSSSSSASSAQSFSLEGFFNLPCELKFRIIELACRSPAPPPPPKPIWEREEDDKVPPVLDTGTTFSLLLGSPDLYALVLPILWRDVMLSRPSALISFREAITSNPQLGLFVVNLHVGPSDELPGWAYPLSERKGFNDSHCSGYSNAYHPATMQITPSVRGNEQPHLNIKQGEGIFSERVWTVGDEHFELDASDHFFPGYQEVVDMLGEAQEVIDVDLQNEGYSYDPKTKLAPVEYIARVYEAQAVLDLYLIEMARRQVRYDLVLPPQEDNKRLACPHLIIEGYPNSPAHPTNEDEEVFILTPLDLLQHLARPGSVTDRFDSPLLFARSGVDIVKQTPSAGRRKRLDISDGEREQDWADIFSPSSSIFSGSSVSTISLPSPHSGTIGSLLTQLRMVLASTPNLENLSLTGFLERAICGKRSAAPLLPKLRALSVGPPPQRWCAPIIFDQLGQIKELRICGIELLQEEAESVVAKLPVLKTLQWSMPNTPASQSYAPK